MSIETKTRAFVTACMFACACATTNPVTAKDAVSCYFEILKHAHEALVYCEEPMSATEERRSAELRHRLSEFVRKNRDPIKRHFSKSEEEIRRDLRNKERTSVCQGADYDWLRSVFSRWTSDAGMAEINKLISTPRDPDEGDCL